VPTAQKHSVARGWRRFSTCFLDEPHVLRRKRPPGREVSVSVRVLIISGSMGSGKTTVLGEVSDLLSAYGLAHGAVDLDAIGASGLPGEVLHELEGRNLEAVYANFLRAGIVRVLLAEAVESRVSLDRLLEGMPGAEVAICRLTASVETMQRRVRLREPGILQDRFARRSEELERILKDAALEDFTVDNNGRPITEVAQDVLRRAGWIPVAG
jgi:hypothetical protein